MSCAGADRPLQRRGVNRTQNATVNVRANQVLQNNNSFPGGSMQRGDSLLMELSQGLSAPAAPSRPSTGAPLFAHLRPSPIASVPPLIPGVCRCLDVTLCMSVQGPTIFPTCGAKCQLP